MTIEQVISGGEGELAGPHGSPAAETEGNTIIAVEIQLPARRGERRFRTEFFELTPAQYKRWAARCAENDYAAELGIEDDAL